MAYIYIFFMCSLLCAYRQTQRTFNTGVQKERTGAFTLTIKAKKLSLKIMKGLNYGKGVQYSR